MVDLDRAMSSKDPVIAANFAVDLVQARVARAAACPPHKCRPEPDTLSCQPYGNLIAVQAETDRFWYKANSQLFADEADITRALSHRFPRQIPAVAAGGEGWILTRQVPERNGTAQPEDVATLIAKIQQDSVSNTAEYDLVARNRALIGLEKRLAIVLTQCGLDPETPQYRQIGIIQAVLLQDADVTAWPTSVTHGDLHPGNVILGNSGPMILDWSDASWAHPLTDLGYALMKYPESQARVFEKAYCRAWETHLPGVDPARAARFSPLLACLHQLETHAHFMLSLTGSGGLKDIRFWTERGLMFARQLDVI